MKLSIAIQTPEVEVVLPVALASGTLEQKLSKAAAWGADGVELMTANPRALDWESIRTMLKTHSLEASAIASGALGFGLGLTLLGASVEKMETARIRLVDLIDMADALGAGVVTIGSFRGRVKNFDGDGASRLAEILTKAGHHAQKKGVCLALEPLNRFESDFINNVEEGLHFMQLLSHPAVGLLLDTFHINIEESSWTQPFRTVSAAKKLFHVHLGDNNRLPPGKGLIDFPAIVKTLRELNYTGYLSAELLAKPDPDTAAQQTLEYMRRLV